MRKVAPETEYELVFVSYFRHWKTGKLIRARDYGYEAFPLRIKKR